MADVVIRQLSETDWETLREIRLRALDDSPDAYGRTYAHEKAHTEDVWRERASGGLAGPPSISLIAESDGRSVGMAGSRVRPHDEQIADLFAMWVAPQARGRGIAAALVEHICTWAAATGCHEVHLSVTEGNNAAVRLYERSGFEPTGEREPLRESSDLWMAYMRKVLP